MAKKARNIKLQGQNIPLVKKYTYLGVIFRDDLDISEELMARQNKARKALFGIRAFLTNKMLPINIKALILRACVEAVMLFGSELWGMNGIHTQPLQKLVNMGIRWILGSSAMNTMIPMKAALEDLNIPPIEAEAASRRARLYAKASSMKLWIKDLIQNPFIFPNYVWSKGSELWLKKYMPKFYTLINQPHSSVNKSGWVKVLARELKMAKWQSIADKDKSKALQIYKNVKYAETRGFIKQYATHPELAEGARQLIRARVNACLTLKKLYQMRVIDRDKCTVCGVTEDIEHLLIDCKRFAKQRRHYHIDSLVCQVQDSFLGRKIHGLVQGNDKGQTLTKCEICQLLFGGEIFGKKLWQHSRKVRDCIHFQVVSFLNNIWPRLRAKVSCVKRSPRINALHCGNWVR